MPANKFSGEYPPDWRAIRDAVYEATGHRCIRCGHPYTKGNITDGWSPCDVHCTHGGTLAVARFPWEDAPALAQWRILTVHHFDGNKSNNEWWNLLPLCQRCHLEIQGKVDPHTPFFFEHSEWLKPYVAGFYAQKYEGQNLTRAEVMARLGELLAHEQKHEDVDTIEPLGKD